MATLGMNVEAANARLVKERIETIREQLVQLQDQVDCYDAVAKTLVELPNKVSHRVMVPLGKRAMISGRIVRSNEVLAHLGDEYYSWRSTAQTLEILERKRDVVCKQIKTQEENLHELSLKNTDVQSIAQLQQMYNDENICEIQETEEQSDLEVIPRATEEDIKEYFDIEEDERRKQEQALWNWDDIMKRMESLEAQEAADVIGDSDDVAMRDDESKEAQAAALKAKGNDAFARRRYKEAAEYYSQAIELDPISYILYGNRAAAYHRLKEYKLALKDSDVAISLHEPWVKGHYRRACALAELGKFEEAAGAYERATELCPTDGKLVEKVKQMRKKANAKLSDSEHGSAALTRKVEHKPTSLVADPVTASSPSLNPPAPPAMASSVLTSSESTAFSGSIKEREMNETVVSSQSTPVSTPLPPRYSRFNGSNYTGQVVTLEPVGEAQPVKRVSRFKAARAARESS